MIVKVNVKDAGLCDRRVFSLIAFTDVDEMTLIASEIASSSK